MEILDFTEHLNFYFDTYQIELSDSVRKIIDENWKANLAKHNHLFNGDIVSLKEINRHDDKIDFIFYLSDYAHFLASFQNKIPSELHCRNLHVSALIETSDNFIVFAKTGLNSFDSGRYQFIGGGLDSRFIENDRINFTECIRAELLEELNIELHDKEIVDNFSQLYFGIAHGLSMIYKIKLKISSSELNKKLDIHNERISNSNEVIEIAKLFFVNKDNYKETLSDLYNNPNNNLSRSLYAVLDTYFKSKVKN